MNIEIEKSALKECVDLATKVVRKEHPLPILQHILLEARDNALRVHGTCLDSEVQACRDGLSLISEDGAVCAKADTLADIVAKLPSGPVYLDKGKYFLNLRSGRSKFELPVLPPEEFPAWQQPAKTKCTLDAKTLFSQIKAVANCANTRATREVFGGIDVVASSDDGQITLTATDGIQIGYARAEWTGPSIRLLLPQKEAKQASKILEKSDLIEFSTDGRRACFSSGGTDYQFCLMEGIFPTLRAPVSFASTLMLDAENFRSVLARALLVAEHDQICLTFEAEMCRVTSQDALNSFFEEFSAIGSGPPLSIRCNASILRNVLGSLEGDIELGFNTPHSAFRVQPIQQGTVHLTYLVAPCKENE